jgi:ATP-dependent RNA helicase DeaD
MQDGYDADSLHGDLSQAQRDLVMSKYRNHSLQLLVATDVASRGLDVDDVSHIINYGLPDDVESYTHRSGRTGRAGKTGTSISITHIKEKSKIAEIERQINKKFEKQNIPQGDVICEKQLFNFVDKIEKVKVNEEEIERLLPSIFRKLEWLDKEDIIKRIVSLEFNRLIEYYQEAEEIFEPTDGASRRRKGETRGNQYDRNDGGSRQAEKGYSRLFINVGKMDGINPAVLMGFINDNVKGKVPIGKIDLMRSFSFFEVPEEHASKVVDTFKGMHLEDRKLLVQFAQDADNTRGGKPKKEFFGNKRSKKGKKQRY